MIAGGIVAAVTTSAPCYEEFGPPERLAPFVHCFWHFRSDAEAALQPIVPDGRPELIVHLGNPYREWPTREVQAPILFAGQLTRPLNLVADGPVNVWGIRFRPDGASPFLGSSLEVVTDRRLPLSVFHGPEADDLLVAMRSIERGGAAQAALVTYLMGHIEGAFIDEVVREAVDAIMAGRPWTPPETPGTRQFQRRFRKATGISPRMLQAIRRFRSLFDRMDEDRSWSLRALDAGYFDQPQMARDFRRFLGCTARQWLGQPEGLARTIGEGPA